jgi:hypothetical protein
MIDFTAGEEAVVSAAPPPDITAQPLKHQESAMAIAARTSFGM